MDEAEYQHMIAARLAGSAADRRAPVPPRGVNREFDLYFDDFFGSDSSVIDVPELRRAAWATWRTQAPETAPASRGGDDEDDELARALALSREDISATRSRQRSIEVVDDRDDDEQLRLAIAASEEEARAPKRQKREETPEDERKMMEEALAASLASEKTNTLYREESDELIRKANEEFQAQRAADRAAQRKARLARIAESSPKLSSNSTAGPSVPVARPERPTAVTAPRQPGTVNPLLADRAKMEQERLARQQARNGNGLAAISSSSATPQAASPAATANGHAGPSSSTSRHPYQSEGTFPRDAAGEYYIDGELRHSALTIGRPASERTFAPGDIIGQKSQISLLILNSFVIDDEWLSTILPDAAVVPQIIIRPHPKDQPGWNGKVQAQPSGEVWSYPRMVGEFGSAHMKYIWIFYKTGRLRVVISTANFVSYDWDFIENPLRTGRKTHDFPLQFRHLFKHLKVHKALQYLIANHPKGKAIPMQSDPDFADMQKWDWSRVTVRLVMSIPGAYEGWEEMDRWGMCRIGRIVRDEGWRPVKGEKAVVEYQGSSLSSYSIDWFSQFHQLCSGKTARELANQPKPKAWAPIKIVFPSLATVDASEMGRPGGGTMFIGKAWNSVMAPHFHDSNSKRGGVLLHAKLLVTTLEPQEQPLGFAAVDDQVKHGKRKADEMARGDGEDYGGWIYVGSHNFSTAAWGTVNVKKSPPTHNIRNYELGILFPLPRKHAQKTADRIVPYRRPARPYGASDVPWDQKLHAQA